MGRYLDIVRKALRRVQSRIKRRPTGPEPTLTPEESSALADLSKETVEAVRNVKAAFNARIVKVDGQKVGKDPAGSSALYKCFSCGESRRWRTSLCDWRCAKCHPPAPGLNAIWNEESHQR